MEVKQDQPPAPIVTESGKSVIDDTSAAMQGFIEAEQGEPKAPTRPTKETTEIPAENLVNEEELLEFRESGDPEQPEDSGGASDPLDALIEIDGQRLKAKEWKDGYMKSQDYTRKTQELATKRKATEELLNRTSKMQEQYAAGLGLLTKSAREEVALYQGVDWQRMANEAPVEYIKHQAAYNAAIDNLRRTEAQAQDFFKEVSHSVKQKQSVQAVGAIKDLQSSFKNWSNKTYYELVDYGVSTGLDRNQLLSSTDPGLFKALHKARMFDIGRGVKTTQKAVQPTNAFGRNERGQFKSSKTNALQKLKSTGSRRDGEAAMAEFLGV